MEVLKVLPTVCHPAILEREDDAVGNVQVFAVSVRGAALDADDAVVTICSQAFQFGAEVPPVFWPSRPKYAKVASRPW